jgi:hypothetical protein
LTHSRPYKPQGRGKIERWFKNIRDSFLPLLAPEPMTLDALNERLDEFVAGYQDSEHSSIGMTPYERYRADLACVRPAPERLIDYFRSHECRRVRKDRTVQLHRKVYEVSAKLIDKTVDLLFHADEPDAIEVQYQGISHGLAVPLDLAVNARGGRDWGTQVTAKRGTSEERSVETAPPPSGGQLFNGRVSAYLEHQETQP